ncbi:MAG: hypothetical protein NTW66_02985 [Candidatus Magasanikbacteria bacterium]|nr:hypothetical protein [Candidatus Magasanikbacteria bacterium]
MKKIICLSSTLIIAVFLLSGCASVAEKGAVKTPPENKTPAACQVDSDCVPKPECHPMECIPSKDAKNYEKPKMCTLMFSYQAAYSAEDCACVEGACVNKNIGRKAEY